MTIKNLFTDLAKDLLVARSPVTAGLASGAAMSLIVDEGLTPLLGFSAPNRAYPLSTHIRAFAAHLSSA